MNQHSNRRPVNRTSAGHLGLEQMESRTMLSAVPTVSIRATVKTASAISPVTDGLFTVTRTGSTKKSLVVYYRADTGSTATSHEIQKLTGAVTISAGKTHASIGIIPRSAITVSTDPVLKLVLRAFSTYTRGTTRATVTIAERHGSTVIGQRYFVPISVAANGFARTDEPVDQNINFTTALSAASGSGSIIDNSIKVVETDSTGNTVLASSVPFQFDKASGYNAASNASGNLVLQMSGSTGANQTRHYRVYFDTTGTYSAPSFTNQVTVTSGNDAVNLDSYKITNATATYVMQKSTGGISAILDSQSHDWVGFNSAGGQSGEYRGTPNLGTDDGLHPYDPTGNFPASGAQNSVTTTLVSSGPLKTTFDVASTDNHVDVTYEFYKNFVRVSVNKNDNQPYWFLYEGTPGGAFNSSDTYLLSDSTTGTLADGFAKGSGIGDSTVGQWAAFQSVSENRFIYFAKNVPSAIEDSYYGLSNGMTVFGFGRTSPNSNPSQAKELAGANVFTIGLADGNSATASTVNGQYRDLAVALGTGTHIG